MSAADRDAAAAALELMCAPGGVLSVKSARATDAFYDGTAGRLRVWKGIFAQILAKDVPRQGRAVVVMAGPPGAGKSTVLSNALAADLSTYRRLDADVIKEHLIKQVLVDGHYDDLLSLDLPDGRPLMPMELAGLVHAESIEMLHELQRECMQRRENLVLEGTLAYPGEVGRHLRAITGNMYDELGIVVVDVEQAVARQQALARWWERRIDPAEPLGGRFTPKAAIDRCYDHGVNVCRTNAENLLRHASRLPDLSARMIDPDVGAATSLRVVGEDE